MKIGIITYWQSNDNYGQLLQCFALQRYFIQIGHEPFLIRYDMANRHMANSKWKKVLKILMVYPVLKYLLNKKKMRQQAKLLAEISKKNTLRKFDDFRKQMIVQSSQLYSSLKELQHNPPQADLYVTGSDQVWSQLLSFKENEAFFLNFGDNNIKRMSYAASFGMSEYPEKLKKDLKDNLSRLDLISVRESDGVNICAEVGVKAQVVLDPTFLLSADIYKSISVNSHKNEHYIYIYSLNVTSSDEMYFSEVKAYAKDKHLNVIVTPASGCRLGLELFGEEVDYDYATIQEWLANIESANLVVTTSFHGIVFSILMHTPFVYVPLRGNLAKMNNRALNLLTSIGLSNRIVDDKADFRHVIASSIDWFKVDNLVNKNKQQSFEFIKKALKYESSI